MNKPNIVVADSGFKFNLRNMVLIVVILGLIAEGGWIYFHFQNTKKEANAVTNIVAPPVPKQPVSMTLTSSQDSYKIGDDVEVSVNLSTGHNSIAGVDAYLLYDPQSLEASASAVEKTGMFADYPQITVSPKDGKIMISAISNPFWSIGGDGVLANVKFKAKKAGATQIKFDFTPGSTTDSNVVSTQSSDDLLQEVHDLNLVIK